MINNLYESMKNLTEKTLPQKLVEMGIPGYTANEAVKELSFAKYTKLSNAVLSEDMDTIHSILSEADNAYRVDRIQNGKLNISQDGENTELDLNDPNQDKVVSVADKSGKEAMGANGKPLAVDPDTIKQGEDVFVSDMDEDLERIRELAGLHGDGKAKVSVGTGTDPGGTLTHNLWIEHDDGTRDHYGFKNGDGIHDSNITNGGKGRMSPSEAKADLINNYNVSPESVDKALAEMGFAIDETASAGATGAGGIATVPAISGNTRKHKSCPGTTVGSDKYTGY